MIKVHFHVMGGDAFLSSALAKQAFLANGGKKAHFPSAIEKCRNPKCEVKP